MTQVSTQVEKASGRRRRRGDGLVTRGDSEDDVQEGEEISLKFVPPQGRSMIPGWKKGRPSHIPNSSAEGKVSRVSTYTSFRMEGINVITLILWEAVGTHSW
jgi:hypothetical protein